VKIEGVKVISQLDLVAKVGPKATCDVTLPVRVTDGKLNIAFRSVVEYAKVSAIVVQAKQGTPSCAADERMRGAAGVLRRASRTWWLGSSRRGSSGREEREPWAQNHPPTARCWSGRVLVGRLLARTAWMSAWLQAHTREACA
jgi:hypothetical protein